MVYSLAVKRIGGRYPAVFITRKVFFYGLLTILPVFAFQPFSVGAEVLARPAVWGNLLFLGVVASMLCYILWNAAMHRLGAVRTTNYIYFNPLVTIVTAALASANGSPRRPRRSGPDPLRHVAGGNGGPHRAIKSHGPTFRDKPAKSAC